MDNSNSTVLTPGTTLTSQFGTYTIVRVLGQGGFGITYLVESTLYHGNIPVKMQFAIKEHFVSSMCSRDNVSLSINYSEPVADTVERSRDAFVKEARRVQALGINHPNIVRINEVFEANNTAYYVMEYLNGETLEQYVSRRGPLSYAETVTILRPIAEAVGVLHDNNLAHYDIKPQNIILAINENGLLRPVLIDFGLAKHYDHEGVATSTMAMVAFSVGYAPVEQYAGLTDFTPEADVYALAATMYFCLTGENPEQATAFDIETALRRLQPLVPPQTLQGLEHALQMKRQHRTRNANQFISETFNGATVHHQRPAFQPSQPTTIPSKDTTIDTEPKEKKNLRIILWAVLGAVATVVIILLSYNYSRSDNGDNLYEEYDDTDVVPVEENTEAAPDVDLPSVRYYVKNNGQAFGDENAQLWANVDGEDFAIGSISYIFGSDNMANMEIFAQEDFDGDGITDALVSDTNIGSGGGSTWAFVTYAGDNQFKKSSLFVIGYDSHYGVEIQNVNNVKVVDFTCMDMGEKVVKERHGLRNGDVVSLPLPGASTTAYTPLKTIDMDNMDETESFYYDLNDDGTNERIASTGTYHFGRTFDLFMNGTKYEFSIGGTWGAGKLHILKSKTNGMHDLLLEQDSRFMYKWDGTTYEVE